MDLSQSSSQEINHNHPSTSSSQIPPVQPIEKEHLFDKIVTPSDVGKLNRLVIPKQHAERCFPLDTTTHEKGLLLNFEDRTGKSWRFRYSYWNSSQSYVMTKGWSRFVKEKRLNAGDTVSFGRAVGDKERLFIDWRRRPEMVRSNTYPMVSFGRSVMPRSNYLYNVGGGGGGAGQFLVFRTPLVGPGPVRRVEGTVDMPIVLDSVPVVVPSNVGRTVRLFGVDLDLPTSQGSGEASTSSSALSLVLEEKEEKEKKEPSLDLQM